MPVIETYHREDDKKKCSSCTLGIFFYRAKPTSWDCWNLKVDKFNTPWSDLGLTQYKAAFYVPILLPKIDTRLSLLTACHLSLRELFFNKNSTEPFQAYLPLQCVLDALRTVRKQPNCSCCPGKAYRPWGRQYKQLHGRWRSGSGKRQHLTRWTGSSNGTWAQWAACMTCDFAPKKQKHTDPHVDRTGGGGYIHLCGKIAQLQHKIRSLKARRIANSWVFPRRQTP